MTPSRSSLVSHRERYLRSCFPPSGRLSPPEKRDHERSLRETAARLDRVLPPLPPFAELIAETIGSPYYRNGR